MITLFDKLRLSGRNEVWCAVVVCVITFFVNNWYIVPDIMESRNIVTAREMVYDGNWIVPTMNGELRLEKPPLPTWFAAGAEFVSPDNLAVQRFMAGMAALLLVFFFWKFAKYVLHRDPLIPTLILCTCYNFILMGRTATWDIYCHAFMMAAIYLMARALLENGAQWRRFALAGIFIGFSLISKGPVSLYALFLPFVIAFGSIFRPSLRHKVLPILLMVVVSLIVGGWWYLYVHIACPEAFEYVVKKESGSWINYNVRPWWYYWQFFLESGVWSLLLLTSIFLPLFFRKRRTSREWLFPLIWMLASLVLLSCLPEKKPRYLLPLLIPAAYLMADQILAWTAEFANRQTVNQGSIWLYLINSGLITIALFILPPVAWYFAVDTGYMAKWLWVLFSIVDIFCVWWCVYATFRLNPAAMVGSVTVVFLAAECFAFPSIAKVAGNPERHSIELIRSFAEVDSLPFYHLETEPLRIELVYAANKKIRPISPDTLDKVVPMVLLTHESAEKVLDSLGIKNRKIREIDIYDENIRPRDSRRYNPDFVYHATIIE